MKLDIEFVRNQFPNVSSDWAFFENAGGTFVPATVSARVYDYMRRNQVQPAAPYAASQESFKRIDRSQKRLAEMLNASPKEIVIGHSTTMNALILSHALRGYIQAGDEVVVTELDHEANNGAWRRMAEFGVVVKEWKIDPETGELESVERLQEIITEKTRLVCCTLCSNITGSINNINEIAAMVHDAGAMICVDAVAYAPHRALDMKSLDVDFCLFSLYKLYGPHLGVVFGKMDNLDRISSQTHYFMSPKSFPSKLLVGGYQHEIVAALEGVPEYFDLLYSHHFKDGDHSQSNRYQRVFELIESHEESLSRILVEYLIGKPNVRIIGKESFSMKDRAPTFSFVVDGQHSQKLPRELGKLGIGISSGDFYAKRCIDALGLQKNGGVVRISMAHYNSESEVERLVEALDQVI